MNGILDLKKRVIDFSKYSSIGIGPKVEVFTIDEICKLPPNCFIIGGANNLLICDDPPPLMRLSKKFDYVFLKNQKLHIGGAVLSGKILSFAKKNNISGFEMMQKLPGTLGGMVKMNAGLKNNEIFDSLIKIKTSKGYIKKEKIKHGYRFSDINDIVFEAVFEANKGFDTEKLRSYEQIRKNQPKEKSAGSCFENPKNDYAGRLIEEVGLKGYKIGDMAFSDKHANFLVNLGNGKYQDALSLIELAKKEVFKKFNINLKEEITIIKDSSNKNKIQSVD